MKPEHIHCDRHCDWTALEYGGELGRCMPCHAKYLQAKAELIE